MEPPPYLFGILTLERGPADGYCVQPGNILQGGILYGETGEYSMSGTVFREWDESRPDACWGIQSPDCAISEQFGLTLTATQVAELGALLDALPEDRCELDEMMECDPCVITTVEIGSTTYSDYCCGTQLSPGYDDAFRDLTDFLDGLASNLPCAVADDGCHCLAGATTMAGTTDSCRTDWSCCIHVPMYTDMFDWACDCVNASEAECDQLLADSSSTAFRVSTCPPP